MKNQRGFTLFELAITVGVIGIVAVMLAPSFGWLFTAQQNSYAEKHRMNNQLISAALTNYAANNTTNGRLPAPYTGGGYTKTVYDSTNATLGATLTQTGINPVEINDDATQSKMVRVYQLVQGLQQQVPLYFQSGPLVTLTYDFGAIYITACPLANSTCNPTAATGVPGTSVALSSANYKTWASSGTDGPAQFVSALPVQKQMLATTVQRLDKLRDTFLTYLRAQQVTAAAGDTTNWFPTGAASLGGATPGTNQGCRDGWYTLSTDTVILATVGLAAQEFGLTAWGGAVQYCRDYDPTGTKVANAPPHYAALRINQDVTSAAAPSGIPGNNVVLTF